jgi:hypothetical protein
VQHAASMLSIATWLPGAIQSTESETGKRRKMTARAAVMFPLSLLYEFRVMGCITVFELLPDLKIIGAAIRVKANLCRD